MRFKALLKEIVSLGGMNLLRFFVDDVEIKVLILELNLDLKEGDFANLYIKPTKLYVSKNRCDFENVLEVDIKNIQKGKIVSVIKGEFKGFEFEAIMLSEMVKVQNKGYLLFKSSDVSVLGKCND
jgi:hypothetical protein